jgi:SAM-dependent methyltransferase
MERSKWMWIETHTQCPQCGGSPLVTVDAGAAMACPACGRRFERASRAVCFLDDELAAACHLADTDNVSDHPFDGNAIAIIRQLARTGGMVLDCGSGSKTQSFPHVVQMEIVDYPLVDVLAVNQRLPFVDGCFDAVFSLDVLEHVDQPFVCAAEIARVLKPGGVLYIDLPFLQAEHGYPNHFFNATRHGLRRLFEGRLEVVEHQVPLSGQPMAAVQAMLDLYLRGLPPQHHERLRATTVGELVEREIASWLDDPVVTHLAEETRWVLASTTQALLRKPATHAAPAIVEPSSLPGFGRRPVLADGGPGPAGAPASDRHGEPGAAGDMPTVAVYPDGGPDPIGEPMAGPVGATAALPDALAPTAIGSVGGPVAGPTEALVGQSAALRSTAARRRWQEVRHPAVRVLRRLGSGLRGAGPMSMR